MVSGEHPFHEDNDSQMVLFKNICKGNIHCPDHLEASDEFYHLVSKSLIVSGQNRIGSLNGCEEIRAHEWFDKLDFDSFRKRELEAPWKPDAEEEQHTLGDGEELKMKQNEETISDEEQSVFSDFGIVLCTNY